MVFLHNLESTCQSNSGGLFFLINFLFIEVVSEGGFLFPVITSGESAIYYVLNIILQNFSHKVAHQLPQDLLAPP